MKLHTYKMAIDQTKQLPEEISALKRITPNSFHNYNPRGEAVGYIVKMARKDDALLTSELYELLIYIIKGRG